jgi:hypothetical protein
MADQTTDQAVQARNKATEEQKENAKKKIAEQRAAAEQRMAEAPDAGKPTPTQEENDMAALGVHLPEHEPDGSPQQDPFAPQDKQTKQSEAKRPGAPGQYATRAATPRPAE